MSSNNVKLHWKKSKKIVTMITLAMLVLICGGFILSSQIKSVYQVSYNGAIIGEASNPEVVKQWFQNEYAKFSSKYPDVQFETNENDFSIVKIQRLNVKAADEEVRSSLQKSFVIVGRGVQVIVNGQKMGIVKDQETAEKILNELKQSVASSKKEIKVQALSYNR